MAKAGFLTGKGKRDVGKAIVDEWRYAAQHGVPVSRQRLVGALQSIIRKAPAGPNHVAVEFDIILDSESDASMTQFVWIAIPIPEPADKAQWEGWITTNGYDQNNKLDKLGEAVLYGCGR